MKKIKISDTIQSDVFINNESKLKEYLDLPYTHWQAGSGESTLWNNKNEGLLFFKIEEGYFIIELSSYLSPIQNENELKWIKHYIGGEPFHFSSRHLCSKDVIIKILIHYANTSEKLGQFNWVDPLPNEEFY